MINLLENIVCTGCSSCENACPKKAISFSPDSFGFLYPVIDSALCVNCKRCLGSCPERLSSKPKADAMPPRAFYFQRKNPQIKQSSSGGAFSSLADFYLKTGGVVYGAMLTHGFLVEGKRIDRAEDLHLIQKTKYTQSNYSGLFRQLAADVRAGKDVLFCGTPCQVAGLYSFLGNCPKNLLTIDLVCHGTASPAFFKTFLEAESLALRKKIVYVDFRSKKRGWKPKHGGLNMEFFFEDGSSKVLTQHKNLFLSCFYKAKIYRESCYGCRFASLPRVGDLTIGDFFGAGTLLQKENGKKHGASCVLVNSKRGEECLNVFSADGLLVECGIETVVATNGSLTHPMSRPKDREQALRSLESLGLRKAVKKYCKIPIKQRIASFIGWDNVAIIKRIGRRRKK